MKSLYAPGLRPAAALAAACAAFLALTASKCVQETTFPGYVDENCADKLDNDEDGKIDCADADCGDACAVVVTIDPLPAVVPADTLDLTGTQTNATSVAVVSVSPKGTIGTAAISGGTWSAKLSNLSDQATYTVTVVGSNGDLKDTARATFIRRN